MAASTSFRISDAARARLASRAAREGSTATALLDQLIIEGIDQRDYPGIVFRGPGARPAGRARRRPGRVGGHRAPAGTRRRRGAADQRAERRRRTCIRG